MKQITAQLLINTGSRKSQKAEKSIILALAANNIIIGKKRLLEPGGDMQNLCQNIIADKPELVIVAGGDGTVSHVLGCFAGSGIEIGIIPLGTTNNFARSLDMPLTIDGAAATIAANKAYAVDLGKVDGKRFANVIGVGLSALIAQHVTDTAKRRFGRFAYAIAGLQQLMKHRAFIATIHDKDDEIAFTFETHQIIIANGRFHAGKQIAADAQVDNRELLIFALGGRSWLSFAWHTLDFYIGKRRKVVHSSYVIGNNVRLETSIQQVVEIDGETVLKTPLSVSVDPKAVLIRYDHE
ncbi:lipid kinase [soil metagenome]